MQPLYEIGRTHHAEALRQASRRRDRRRAACRQRILGMPIGPACTPAVAC